MKWMCKNCYIENELPSLYCKNCDKHYTTVAGSRDNLELALWEDKQRKEYSKWN